MEKVEVKDRVARSSGFFRIIMNLGFFKGGLTKEIRPDQLWGMLLSVKPTPSANAHVESVFPTVKHLYNDKRNHMSIELIAAELKTPLN